jgi:hypothetical protein
MTARRTAAIGLRAKTARAIVVVVADGEEGLEVVRREEIATWNPDVPDSRQPHHAGLELSATRARSVVRAAEAAVQCAARTALSALVSELAVEGFRVARVGVVGPPAKGPEQLTRIGNLHVRAHAAEGQLFRAVLEQATHSGRLASLTLSDRSCFEEAAALMRCGEAPLRRQIDGLGAPLGPPWRADHKLACAAALAALSRD